MLGTHSTTVATKETPEEFADRILRQRDDVDRSRRYGAIVAARVERYEQRYGIKSQEVHDAVKRGDLPESHEVCSWLIDYDLIERSRRP